MNPRAVVAIGWIAWIGVAVCSSPAPAQPIRNRVLEGLSLVRAGNGWRLQVSFSVPVRYLRHNPRDRGGVIDVQLSPLQPPPDAVSEVDARESLRVPRDAPVPLEDVTYEPRTGAGGTLHVRFSRSVAFRVLPGDDLRSIVIELPEAGAAQPGAAEAERAATLLQLGRDAMTAGELERAIGIFTKLLTLPASASTPEAKELLGLARERNGQIAHAKAEYEEYLASHPDGEGAARVRQRLSALMTARAEPVEKKIHERPRETPPIDFQTFGSLYTSYRRESRFANDFGQALTDSSLLSDVFVSSRVRSESYSVRSEFAGGYRHAFLDGGIDDTRVGSLFVEATDQVRGLIGSIGRRSRSRGGVLGRYDGVRLAQRFAERWELSAVGGLPVESPRSSGFESGKYFTGVALDVARLAESIDAELYVIHQFTGSQTDRSAVGGEFRYFDDGRFLAGLVDYDVYFLSLNIAQLVGNWQLTPGLFLNGLVDYRNVPSLSTSNALQGQLAGDLDDLRDLFSSDEIKTLAEDRTARALTATLGASYDLRPDLQLGFDFGTSNFGPTETSGGVESVEKTGYEFSYLGQLIANGVLRDQDVGILGLRYFDGAHADTASVSFDYRFPIVSSLRINSRLRADYRIDGSDPDWFTLRPSLRLDYRWRAIVLDTEAGIDWMPKVASGGRTDEWGYYAGAGIRYDF